MKTRINLHSPVFKILLIFLTWRFALVVISFLAIHFIPLGYKDRFLGGGLTNYSLAPGFFAWANFDGEHYLSIAIFGYKHLEQAFFPVYPILMSFFSKPDPYDLFTSLVNSTLAGLIISNVSFVLALIFLWELIRIDFSKKIAYLTIILLLIFPTSFYFGAVYNESLFLLLSVLVFYSARKGKWFVAGVLGLIASATRVFGILLLPALLIEIWQQKADFSKAFWVLLVPFGLGAYMWYLYLTIGDPIAFYNLQRLIGEQHQPGITTLPQVYFRYIKMMATTSIQNPIFQTVVLEFLVGLAFFLLPIYGYFKKIRFSYLIYAMIGFVAPTIQGSFSSTPRYVLILFPSFLAAAIFVTKLPKLIKVVFLLLSFFVLIIETALYLRGYWVA
ncbi:glycosyltransferase family 39 protein [Patescibacteria group bacterium]|nr:glycosyltransferase family 39 protein [Patescibacteria group bacterium]